MRISASGRTRLVLALIGTGLLLGISMIAGSHFYIRNASGPHCHSKLDDVPAMKTALVLGCAPTVQGRPNLFFTKRMEAAAALFQAGKVQALILCGDNGSKGYDEATAMKDALVKAGVPESRMHLDYAGFRTLDSVVRAKEVFGQESLIIVSQKFHNERAVYLTQAHGIKAEAYNARDVVSQRAMMTHLREYLARVQAVLDVVLLDTKPKFLGDPVVIP